MYSFIKALYRMTKTTNYFYKKYWCEVDSEDIRQQIKRREQFFNNQNE